MEKRRVVVTGLGTVNPTGNSVAESWGRIKNGEVGIGAITQFDTTGFSVKLAGEVKNFDPSLRLDKREARRMARFTQFALYAAEEAIPIPVSSPDQRDKNPMKPGQLKARPLLLA